MRAVTKAELIVKRRKMMLFAGILAALIIGMISFSINASAEDSREVYTYYTSYEVQAGDTLSKIARNLGTTVQNLIEKNNIADPNKIYPNQKLVY